MRVGLCHHCMFSSHCLGDCLQHIEKVLQHKDLETQLLEAKLSQATVQLAEEKERTLQEKQQVRKIDADAEMFLLCGIKL